MQLRDKNILEKILSVIKESDEIFKNISKEEFLKNNLLKMAMTMAILRGIDLLELDKPKKFKNLSAFKNSNDDAEN